jgi:hypothetical protein
VPALSVSFAIADIGRLVRNPDASLACERVRKGESFSYFQRSWLHQAAAASFEADGDPAAFRDRLSMLVASGQGPTPFKKRVQADLLALLPALARLNRQNPARYVTTLYRHIPSLIVWKDHALKLPLGLLFEDERGMVMRTLWMESYLRPRVRGIDMTAVALSVVLPAGAGIACSIEPWFLRDTDRRFYASTDLRALRPRLDRILSYAEQRRRASPAA